MSLKAAILLLVGAQGSCKHPVHYWHLFKAVVTTGAARLKQKAPKQVPSPLTFRPAHHPQVLALDRDGHTKMLLQALTPSEILFPQL